MDIDPQQALIIDASRVTLDGSVFYWVVFALVPNELGDFLIFCPDVQPDSPELGFGHPDRAAYLAEVYAECVADGSFLLLLQRDHIHRGTPVVAASGHLFAVTEDALPTLFEDFAVQALLQAVQCTVLQVWPEWATTPATGDDPAALPENEPGKERQAETAGPEE